MPIMDGIEACSLIIAYLRQAEAKNQEDSDEEEKEGAPLQRQRPFIYALTSEIDADTIRRMHEAGFKEICKCNFLLPVFC